MSVAHSSRLKRGSWFRDPLSGGRIDLPKMDLLEMDLLEMNAVAAPHSTGRGMS
jgi:hypothetical protein